MEKEKEIYELTKGGEYRDAIDQSRVYLQTHPLSLLVLREISYAYNRLRMADSAKYFMDLNDKLMEAMIYSGKGKKPEAPIFSLGLADGEYFIPNIGYTIERKDTEWNKYNDFVEVIEAFTDLDAKVTFYFAIQHAKLKIDDDAADELANKKKKPAKKKGKDNKQPKPVTTDSIPAPPSN